MKSTLGRPRSVTDAQVKKIMDWFYSPRSLRKFAASMQLPMSTVMYCIQCRGKYKQASPELREEALNQHRCEVARLRSKGWL